MREHWILPTEQELAMAGLDWLLLLVHKNSLEVLEKKIHAIVAYMECA
jgi:hypothetical protein